MNVKPRNESEKRLLGEAKKFVESIENRIADRHLELDKLRLEQRIEYQNRLKTQGLEGVRMADFIRHVGGWVEKVKRE